MSEDNRRQLRVVNIVEEIKDNQKYEKNMWSGCHLFDVHVKLYFMNLMENDTLVTQEKYGGTK
jgi:hypothetical protein